MRKYSFFFHYNKPASQKAGSPKMSVHYRGVCHVVDHVVSHVGCESKYRKQQPHCVMSGQASNVTFRGDGKVLTAHIL